MPNFEGFEEEAPKAPDFAAMGFTPDESAFVGPQPPIPTAEQEALQAPAIDPVSTAVGMGTLGVVPTAIGLATEPGFRENVGKPVQNLVAKVAPKAAPYVGEGAEILAGLGLGAGMGKGTSAGRVTMEDAPAAPISPVERAQASEAEIVPQAPQPQPQNGAQRLLEGPAAASEAPAQPQPVQPQQSGPRALPAPTPTKIDPITLSENQEQQFVKGVLGRYEKGKPGLEVIDSDNPNSVYAHHVVYRGPDGTPVAAAQVYRERDGSAIGASGLAADKSKGLLSGKAAIEVAKELRARGWDKPPPDTQMTPDSLNLMERGNKAGLEQQPTKALRVGDKIIQPEPTDVMHAQMFERLAPEDQEKAEPGWMVNGEFKSEPRTVPFKKPDLAETAQNLGPQDASQPISAENAPSTTQPQNLEGFSESNDPAPVPEQDPFKRADVFEVPTKSALLDPETFQYKVDVDPKTGVGKSLSESSKYNPDFAGVEEMWHDADTGKLYVSHGHHRHNLALKSDAPSVRAVILDSGNSFPGAIAHNVTKEEARTRGALVNFSEGRGTVVDAANYLRNAPDMTPEKMKAMGLDLGDEKMSQAINVKNLTEPIWYQVSIGKLKPEIGSIIGKNLDKPRDQIAAYKAYEQTGNSGRPMSTSTFDNFVKLIKNGGEHTETTEDLFGAHQISRSTYQEQAEILANAARELSMEKNVMGTAAKQKSRLEKGQNVINAETSQAMSKEAQDRLAVLQAYGDKPGTHSNAVLKKFAAHLAEKPKQRAAILKEAYDALVKAIDQDNPGMPAEQEDSKSGSLF